MLDKHSDYEQTFDNIHVQSNAKELRITRAWAKPAGYVMLGWVFLWFGMVGFFTSLGNQPFSKFELFLALLGIGMSYAALTRFLNCTVIEANATQLAVRHTPLFWPGNKHFARREIAAIYSETRRVYAKGHNYNECWILVVKKNGKKKSLLKGLEMTESQMSLIVAAVSDYLGIPCTADRK